MAMRIIAAIVFAFFAYFAYTLYLFVPALLRSAEFAADLTQLALVVDAPPLDQANSLVQ